MLEDLKSKMITFDSTEKAIEEIKNDLDKYKDELSNGETSFIEKSGFVIAGLSSTALRVQVLVSAMASAHSFPVPWSSRGLCEWLP